VPKIFPGNNQGREKFLKIGKLTVISSLAHQVTIYALHAQVKERSVHLLYLCAKPSSVSVFELLWNVVVAQSHKWLDSCFGNSAKQVLHCLVIAYICKWRSSELFVLAKKYL
jgi:hypothetical protein